MSFNLIFQNKKRKKMRTLFWMQKRLKEKRRKIGLLRKKKD